MAFVKSCHRSNYWFTTDLCYSLLVVRKLWFWPCNKSLQMSLYCTYWKRKKCPLVLYIFMYLFFKTLFPFFVFNFFFFTHHVLHLNPKVTHKSHHWFVLWRLSQSRTCVCNSWPGSDRQCVKVAAAYSHWPHITGIRVKVRAGFRAGGGERVDHSFSTWCQGAAQDGVLDALCGCPLSQSQALSTI